MIWSRLDREPKFRPRQCQLHRRILRSRWLNLFTTDLALWSKYVHNPTSHELSIFKSFWKLAKQKIQIKARKQRISERCSKRCVALLQTNGILFCSDYEFLGRIPHQSPKATPSANAAAQFRLNRRNHAKQAQIIKRSAIISATRMFSGANGAPRIVAVIPLTPDVGTKSAVSSLAEVLNISANDCPEDGLWRMRYVALLCRVFLSKTRYQGRSFQDVATIPNGSLRKFFCGSRRLQSCRLRRVCSLQHSRSERMGWHPSPHPSGARSSRRRHRRLS